MRVHQDSIQNILFTIGADYLGEKHEKRKNMKREKIIK